MKDGAGTVGNYKAPAHTSSRVRKNTMKDGESTGLSSGLSSLSKFDCDDSGPVINNKVDSMTGNAQQRLPENPRKTTATSKGNKFDLC